MVEEPLFSNTLKSERTKEKGYERLFVEAVDESLRQVLGEATKSIYKYLEDNLHFKLEDVVEKPEVFMVGLERLLGSAAPAMNKLILQSLYSKLGLEYTEKTSYLFRDYIKELTNDNVTIVLPALNEEEAVGPVIDELREVGYEKILLVDGHSSDNTVNLALEHRIDVILQIGEGKAGAIWTAIQKIETPYIVIMDCDYTYNPRDIESLLYETDGNDLVIGVRMKGRSNISLIHRFGNWVIKTTFKYLFGSSLKDVCSGMYLLKTKAAKKMDLSSKGFAVEVDIVSQMLMNGSVGEVPISYRTRVGKRKLSRWSDGLSIFFSLFKLTRRHNPMVLFLFLALAAGVPALLTLFYVALEVLLNGVWHSGYALFSGILLLAAFQCFMVAVFSILMKRLEKRVERYLRK